MSRATGPFLSFAVVPVLLLAGCGGASDGGDATPGSVAQEWATDVLLKSGAGAAALQCRPGVEAQVEPVRLTLGAATGVTATTTDQVAAARWKVTLSSVPNGGTSFTVTVVEQDGKLTVCG